MWFETNNLSKWEDLPRGGLYAIEHSSLYAECVRCFIRGHTILSKFPLLNHIMNCMAAQHFNRPLILPHFAAFLWFCINLRRELRRLTVNDHTYVSLLCMMSSEKNTFSVRTQYICGNVVKNAPRQMVQVFFVAGLGRDEILRMSICGTMRTV